MTLTKEKACLLLTKLEKYCVGKGIIKGKNKSMRLLDTAKIIMRRYGSVVLVEGNGTKYLCNNAKYLKKWALGESLKNTGSSLKLSLCGEIAKKLKTKQHG